MTKMLVYMYAEKPTTPFFSSREEVFSQQLIRVLQAE